VKKQTRIGGFGAPPGFVDMLVKAHAETLSSTSHCLVAGRKGSAVVAAAIVNGLVGHKQQAYGEEDSNGRTAICTQRVFASLLICISSWRDLFFWKRGSTWLILEVRSGVRHRLTYPAGG